MIASTILSRMLIPPRHGLSVPIVDRTMSMMRLDIRGGLAKSGVGVNVS
jgi:hypothetical protein